MQTTAEPSLVVHPDVVDVCGEDAVPRQKRLPFGRSPWQEHAVDRSDKGTDAGRDVANVDDPVVGEERRVVDGIGDEGGSCTMLEDGRLLDRPPVPLLQLLTQMRGSSSSIPGRSTASTLRHRSSGDVSLPLRHRSL
jgi:hypothetical protein